MKIAAYCDKNMKSTIHMSSLALGKIILKHLIHYQSSSLQSCRPAINKFPHSFYFKQTRWNSKNHLLLPTEIKLDFCRNQKPGVLEKQMHCMRSSIFKCRSYVLTSVDKIENPPTVFKLG